MRRPRQITTAVLIAIVAALCPVAAASASNPLLSGYGGPGAGNQAILGSTLIGGSGGSGGGPSGGGATGSSETQPTQDTGAAAPTPTRSSKRPSGHARRGSTTTAAGVSHSSKGARGAYQPAKALGAGPASDSRTLGLSGEDLLYIILALGLLALIGALTARLSARPQRGPSG